MKTRLFAFCLPFASSLSSAFLALAILTAGVLVTTGAHAQMSETEKKAAARAAYQEGVKLQDDGKAEEALKRFEAAEKLFDAPTHLLHIAECQALTGRLVESSETYETLARKTLPPGAPDAFTQAQQQGQAELPALRARVPSLRVTIKPGPQQVQNLQVNVNGVNMPNELLGIARPLNPGTYRFNAQAVGWATSAPIDVPLGEKEQKSVELTLVQVQGGGAPAVIIAPGPGQPAPAPPPYMANPEKPRPRPAGGPTSAGLLLGLHAGALIPTGDVSNGRSASDFATTGGSGGIDLYARLAKMLLLGAQFEYASLGAPKTVSGVVGNADVKASTSYFGINIGIIPNVDKVSFIGDLGIGSRSASRKVTVAGKVSEDASASGLEFMIGAGVSIPAGPIRIVPKTSIGIGSFSSSTDNTTNQSANILSADRGTHAFIFLGLAVFYSLDFGSKPEPQ